MLKCFFISVGSTLPFPTIIATYFKNLEKRAVVDWKVATHCKISQFRVILHYITLIYTVIYNEITVPGSNTINYHTIQSAVVTFPNSEILKARITATCCSYISAYFHPRKTKWYGLNLFFSPLHHTLRLYVITECRKLILIYIVYHIVQTILNCNLQYPLPLFIYT